MEEPEAKEEVQEQQQEPQSQGPVKETVEKAADEEGSPQGEKKKRKKEKKRSRSRSRSRGNGRSRDRKRRSSRSRSRERLRRSRSRSSERRGRDRRHHHSRSRSRSRGERSRRYGRSRDRRSRDRSRDRGRSRDRSRSPRRHRASSRGPPSAKADGPEAGGAGAAAPQRFFDGFRWIERAAPTPDPAALATTLNLTRAERRLYVGNLPLGITQLEIKAFIEANLKPFMAGQDATVLSVWLSPDGKFSFVELDTIEAAQATLKHLNGIEYPGGKTLRIAKPNSSRNE